MCLLHKFCVIIVQELAADVEYYNLCANAVPCSLGGKRLAKLVRLLGARNDWEKHIETGRVKDRLDSPPNFDRVIQQLLQTRGNHNVLYFI